MKKNLLVALSLTLCLSSTMSMLVGCGKTDSTSASAETSQVATQSSTVAVSEGPVSEAGQFPIVKDPITLTAFVLQGSNQDLEVSSYRQELEKKTNIKLQLTICGWDNIQQKKTLLLSSGDYPDIFWTGHFTRDEVMKYGVQEKILLPINDYVEKYGVNMKQTFSELPTLEKEITATDGNIYGLPHIGQGYHGNAPTKLWINSQWVKNLGMEMPKTTDEFRDVLKAFKTKDPNKNGKADEIGLSGAVNTWRAEPIWFFTNAFIYTDWNTYLKADNGKISFVANTAEWKEALTYINGLYKDGLIDPGAFTQTEAQMKQLGAGGDINTVGGFPCGHLAMAVDTNTGDRHKEYEALAPLTGPKGYSVAEWNSGAPEVAHFCITNKCKYPEAAYRLGDILMDETETLKNEIGKEGLHWSKPAEGDKALRADKPAVWKQLEFDGTKNNVDAFAWGAGKWIWEKADGSNGLTSGRVTIQDIYNPAGYELRLSKATELYEAKKPAEIIPLMFTPLENSEELGQARTAIRDYVLQSAVRFITGDLNLDKDWDTYVKAIDNLKVGKYVEIYQQMYDNYKK